MIQFNLLPEVKLEYIKARRSKRLVLLGSIIATAVSIGILVLAFFFVNILQRQHLNAVQKDVEKYSKELEDEPDLDKILTIQGQLNNLNTYHEQKAASERIGTYLAQVTPVAVSLSKLDVDFSAQTMRFEGKALTLKDVNEYVDTLKFSTYTVDGAQQEDKPFSDVVLAEFSRNKTEASYAITVSFQPALFDNTKTVGINLPGQTTVTTRSATEKPATPLFQPNQTEEGGQ